MKAFLYVSIALPDFVVVWKSIQSRSDTNRTGADGLSFYYPRLLYCPDQILAVFFFSFRPFPLVRGCHSVPSFSTSFCLQHPSPSHQLPAYLSLLHLKIFSLVSLFSPFPVTPFPSFFFLHTLGLSS